MGVEGRGFRSQRLNSPNPREDQADPALWSVLGGQAGREEELRD